MWDGVLKILDYIGGPGFVILAIILCIIIRGVFKIGRFSEKITGIDKTNSSIDEIRKNISEIAGQLSYISSRVEGLSGQNNIFAEKHSPYKLTSKGESLLERTMKFIIDNSFNDILKNYSEIENLSNPFDIEEFCKKITMEIYDKYTSDNDKDKIKNTLFLDGATMNDLHLITWIYLRDKFFEHKGIDIDKMEEEEKNLLKNN